MRLFLIGFMGAGKSYWAERWARTCGWTFMDLDVLLENKTGKSISEIFEGNGEAYFRDLEANILRELARQKTFILACGGGTPCFQDNMEWMKSNGKTVFLQANADTLLSNLKNGSKSRPLLSGATTKREKLEIIEQLLEERAFYYQQADISVRVESLNDDTIFQILKSIDG